MPLAERILVFAPRGRDAELIQAAFVAQGLTAAVCADGATLVAAVDEGAACAVITQEAFGDQLQIQLGRTLDAQPAWSDFPVIVLANAHSAQASQMLALELGNITVLERPLAPHTLLAAVRAALRARRRQYEARAAIQQRDQFLAMLGHELRNPLGAIVLAAQLARQHTDRAQLDPRLVMIERQSQVLGRLVDDLLDVARVTTGKVRLRREAVDIDETIRGCIAALGERAEARSITLTVTGTSGAIVDGDSVRIEQVITNLVMNAIKYSPSDRNVRISTAIDGTMCVIRVRDQGIGVEPEMQRRVFELFTQADGGLDRAEGGMGVGLTLVDRLVRLHGGTVELKSEGLGRGSELIVKLPLGTPKAQSNVISLAPHLPAQLRVVLVEDNADLRVLTRELLEMLNCVVEVSIDGADGLSRIIETKPDLALIDIGLPELDGFGVARGVRAQLGNTLMLVAASGYGLDRDREESARAGFDRHIAKPISAATLREVIEQAVAERDSRRMRATSA